MRPSHKHFYLRIHELPPRPRYTQFHRSGTSLSYHLREMTCPNFNHMHQTAESRAALFRTKTSRQSSSTPSSILPHPPYYPIVPFTPSSPTCSPPPHSTLHTQLDQISSHLTSVPKTPHLTSAVLIGPTPQLRFARLRAVLFMPCIYPARLATANHHETLRLWYRCLGPSVSASRLNCLRATGVSSGEPYGTWDMSGEQATWIGCVGLCSGCGEAEEWSLMVVVYFE